MALTTFIPYTSHSSQIDQVVDSVMLSSAATDLDGRHSLMVTNFVGEVINRLPLPARAHQVFKHPKLPLLCVIGRRPGMYMALVHTKTGALMKQISPTKGYHFYGHGLFSHDGRYLVSSENHIQSGEGRITLRDRLLDFAVVRQYSSHGIGPHEIKLSADGKKLIVANGGIKTHPNKGREKLNLKTMRPSLVYLHLLTGELIEKVSLPQHLHQLSIRHIDINEKDCVVIAMQYQGDTTDQVPLIATHQSGEEIKFLSAPVNSYLAMKHYCGSISYDTSGRFAAATSPRGDRFTLWDTLKGSIVDEVRCRDACGVVAFGASHFIITSGNGKLYLYDIKGKSLKINTPVFTRKSNEKFRGFSWDNHLSLMATNSLQ